MKKISLLLVLLTMAMTSMSQIIEPPQGFDYKFERAYESSCFYRIGDSINLSTQGDLMLEIVFVDNGDHLCYIKNIIAYSEFEFGDYWVEGTYHPMTSTITVPMGQTVYTSRGRTASLAWGTVHCNISSWQFSFTSNSAVTEATYVVDGNSIHIENTDGPVAIDAQEDVSYDATGPAIVWDEEEGEEEEWAGFMEWSTEAEDNISNIPSYISQQPEGTVRYYTRTSEIITDGYLNVSKPADYLTAITTSKDATIVFGDNGKVYILDPFYYPTFNTWVEGTMSDDGSTITFPHSQALLFDFSSGWTPTMTWGRIYLSDATYDVFSFIQEDNDIVFRVEGDNLILEGSSSNINAEYPDNYTATGLYIDLDFRNVVEANVVYTLKGGDPVTPTEKTGAPIFHAYTTDGIHAYFVEIVPTEPSTIYYRVQYPDGTWTNWAEYEGTLSFTDAGKYRIEAYAVASGKLPSEEIACEFVISPLTGVEEMATDKTVANVRYYNMAGQEIITPEGFTIQVTTFTDGTTSVAKFVK